MLILSSLLFPHTHTHTHTHTHIHSYTNTLLERQHHFTPLALSEDVMMREETNSATKQLSAALFTKWDRGYLEKCGYIWTCISLNLVRAFIFLVRVTRSGKTRRARRMPADGEAASRLYTREVYRAVQGYYMEDLESMGASGWG